MFATGGPVAGSAGGGAGRQGERAGGRRFRLFGGVYPAAARGEAAETDSVRIE